MKSITIPSEQSVRTRDKALDLMAAIGIIHVVMGHCFDLPWLFFPPYFFHMPLFFLISGMLFRISLSPRDKLQFGIKKTRSQFLSYHGYNLFFTVVAFVLFHLGLFRHVEINLKNLLIEPFFMANHNPFISPMWFLIQLYLVNLIFQILYWSKSKIWAWVMTPILLAIAVPAAYVGLERFSGLELLGVRTCIAALFFQLGILASHYRAQLTYWLKNPIILIVLWTVVGYLNLSYGNLNVSLLYGDVGNSYAWVTLVTSTLISMIVYGIAHILADSVQERNLALLIGQKSFHIMALHLSFFVVVNAIFCLLGFIPLSQVNEGSFYVVHAHYPYYLLAGILGPVGVAVLWDKIRWKWSRRSTTFKAS